LVVEDTPEDVEAIRRGLAGVGLINGSVVYCQTGDEALDYLHRQGRFADPAASPRPAMMLLDLNLPGTSGREVLSEVKDDPRLKSIPVVIFTSSAHDSDVQGCYAAGANGYVRKPVCLNEFNDALKRIKEFWLDASILPSL
jgi:CheY-like chemotaxis protein